MKCCICGLNPGSQQVKFSENFVTYGDLFNGKLVCETCYKLVRDQKYRRNNWILVDNEVQILDKSTVLDTILNAPVNSLIYVKTRGQKLTYLKALRHRSTRNYVVLCSEEDGLIIAERSRVREYIDLVRKAVETGLKKTELLNGCSTKNWVHRELCVEIEEKKGDPLWRTIVHVI